MTPKEKAKDLIWKFNNNVQWDLKEVSFNGHTSEVVGYNLSFETKKFALIAVDEILSMGIMSNSGDWSMAKQYWQEVKQEIENL